MVHQPALVRGTYGVASSVRSEYLRKQITSHSQVFFPSASAKLLSRDTVVFLPYGDAIHATGNVIAVPDNLEHSAQPNTPYRVPFNGTELTIWNRIPRPPSEEWLALPNEETPLWYRNSSGTMIPAWDMFGNLFSLLTFQEELRTSQRDRHERFIAAYSPRLASDLLEVPTFNETVAAFVAARCSQEVPQRTFDNLVGLVAPPIIVLSHDCDVLRGNDLWTQFVRGYRVVAPMLRGRLPKLQNVWWIAQNTVAPRRYYFENVEAMIDLERQFGYSSTFYLINGSGGRFGARSGAGLIPDVVRLVSGMWRLGVHYNYDTYLDHARLSSQLQGIVDLAPNALGTGRAHYLRFDPARSLPFLAESGFRVDESAGYPDRIGYRCGIGGCFQAYDLSRDSPLDIWEVPLTIMEETLMRQYGHDSLRVFSRLLSHLRSVGGALSVVYHPGVFFNPEFPEFLGMYHRLLIEARQLGARSMTASELVDKYSAAQRM